jgi:hypothetical protein
MRVILVALMAMAMVGCATIQQNLGQASMDRLWVRAEPFCISRAEFDAHATDAMAVDVHVRRPRVGWPACQVLAYIGMPYEQTTVETQGGGLVAHWMFERSVTERGLFGTTYTGEKDYKLVVVEPGPSGKGVVTSVVW